MSAEQPNWATREPAGLPLWHTPAAPARPPIALVPPATTQPPPPPPGGRPPEVDWGLVRGLRARAATELAALAPGADQAAAAEQIVADLVAGHAAQVMTAGAPAPSRAESDQLARALLDSLLGLGRLQPLVDDPELENIEVVGCDPTTLVRCDGRIVRGPAVADTDDELIELLAHLGARADGGARPFSHAHPQLHLELPGGARLAAAAWVTRRPTAVIRLHRLSAVTLADLVANGSIDPGLADLLAAAVRSRASTVLSGAQGVGKTTLLRALAAQIDPWERIGTLETERELHLHTTGHHRRLVEFEARPGSGERTPDGRMAGEISLGELVHGSLRFNLDRFFVGEVRGPEILAMFKAMQAGAGSMSTTHAATARGAIDRLVTAAMEAGAQITADYAYRQVAAHIQLIVQLGMTRAGAPTAPTLRRHIVEVIAIEPGEDRHPATTTVWSHDPRTGTGRPGVLPTWLADQLATAGYDPTTFGGRP